MKTYTRLLVALIVAVCIHTVITVLSGYGNGFSAGSVLLAANGQSGRDDQVAFTVPVREVVVTDQDKDWQKALKKVHKQLSARRKVALRDTLFYGEAQYLGEVFCHGQPIQSYRDYGFYMSYPVQVKNYRGGMRFISVFKAHSYRFDALGQDTIPASPAYSSLGGKNDDTRYLGYASDKDLYLLFFFIEELQKRGPCFCKNLDDYTFSLRQFDGRYYTIGFERENVSGTLTIDAQGPSLHAMKINARFKSQEYELSAPSEAELFFTPQGFVKKASYIHRWQHPYMTSQDVYQIQHPRPDADQNPCEIRIWWKTCSTQRITLKKMNVLPILNELPVLTLRFTEKTAYYPYSAGTMEPRYHASLFDSLPAPDPDFAAVETRLGRNINIREQYANSYTPRWRIVSTYQCAEMYHKQPPLYFVGTPPKHPEKNLGDRLYADMLEKYGK